MKTLNLEQLKVSELGKPDLLKINGGLFWLPIAAAVSIIVSFANNFGDVRHGLIDGWRGTPRYVD